jgi:hypothetical protein
MVDHYLYSAEGADRALDEAQDVMITDEHRPGVRPESFADRDRAMSWFDAEYKTLIAVTRLAARNGGGPRTQWLAWTMVTFLDRRGSGLTWWRSSTSRCKPDDVLATGPGKRGATAISAGPIPGWAGTTARSTI